MCSRISVLATSREFLRVEGEHVFRVPPLDVPGRDRPDDDILEHSAVRLFVTKIQMSSDFSVSRKDLPVIADICRQLDGIPLAIEFAASRVTSLGLHRVASHLDDRFELLTGGRRSALPQHQTLRATLDWSYDLLSEPERCLLSRLAVFPAPFTLDAAAAVARDLRGLSSIADGISNLFSKSLVVLDGPDEPRRWRLLETTRAYAREKLTESGEAELVARYHAEFYRNLIVPDTGDAPVEPAVDDMLRYGREIDNIRAALDWSFSPRGDVVTGILLTAAYVPVWLYFAFMTECRERTERAMKSLTANHLRINARHRLQLQIALGVAMIYTMGLGEGTREDLTRALETAEILGEVDAQLRALWALWALHFYRGDFNQAKFVGGRFLGVALETGDAADALVGDRFMGVAAHFQGQQADARFHLERVLDLYIAPSDRRHARWFHFDQRVLARAMLARVLLLQGFPEQAADAAELSLSHAQSTHHALTICNVLGLSVCPLALRTGNLVVADRALAMLADIVAKHGMSFWGNFSKYLEGELHIKRGEFGKGVNLLRTELGAGHGAGGFHVQFLGMLAEGLAGLGQFGEALVTVDQALAVAHNGGQHWYVPELLRLKGDFLLKETRDQSFVAAEDCLHRALEIAEQQGALYWELRSVISLAQLRMTQGRLDDARQALVQVYNRFTEGVETSDLRAARKMLDELSAHSQHA